MLVTNIITIKNFVPVSTGLSIEAISPYIESVERKYLKPLIGNDFYIRLSNYMSGYGTSGSSDDINMLSEALYFSQKSISNIALWEGFTIFSANISDKGARRTDSEDHKSLFKYQEDELKDRLKNDGNNALDSLLTFLEEKIEYFPEFEDTDTYKNLKSSIIKDTKTFDSIYPIDKSRLVFLHMKPFINEVLDLDIKKVLGSELYNEVLTELEKDTLSTKVTNILSYIQKPLVYYAVARGLDTLGYDITDKGIIFLKSSVSAASFNKEMANDDKIFKIARHAQHTGDRYLEILKQYLIKYAETYPTYSGLSGNIYKRDNTGKKTIWK